MDRHVTVDIEDFSIYYEASETSYKTLVYCGFFQVFTERKTIFDTGYYNKTAKNFRKKTRNRSRKTAEVKFRRRKQCQENSERESDNEMK